MTRFLIITEFGIRECEVDDFEGAVQEAYNDHTGYDHVFAIVRANSGGKEEQ